MAVDEKKVAFKDEKQKGKKTLELRLSRKSSIPPYLTIDDIKFYRRKNNQDVFKKPDNLTIENGSFKLLKSEYQKRFTNLYETLKSITGNEFIKSEPFKRGIPLKLEGTQDFLTEYKNSFRNNPIERLALQSLGRSLSTKQMDNVEPSIKQPPQPESKETKNTLIQHQRPRFRKRLTNLKIEGDLFHVTEHADKFIQYLLEKRAKLLRTPTNLKMEGEMETKTETGEKYIKYDACERPPLCKKLTQLHLEGDLDINTEKREKFVPFEVQKRPPLEKKSTNLHLEGDLTMIPEYRFAYVAYENLERTKPAILTNNLKPGGGFENNPHRRLSAETLHAAIPFLRDTDKKSSTRGDTPRRTPTRLSRAQSFVKTSDNQDLSSRRRAYPDITFTKASDSDISRTVESAYQMPEIVRPKGTLWKADKSKLSKTENSTRASSRREYVNTYMDFPKMRPETGKVSSKVQKKHSDEEDDVEHDDLSDILEPRRREPQLDGTIECQPEYRKAYIDYLVREKKPPLVPKKRLADMFDNGDNPAINTAEEISDSSNVNATSPDVKVHSVPISQVPGSSTSSISSVPSTPQVATRPSQLKIPRSGPSRNIPTRSLTPSPTGHLLKPRRGATAIKRGSRTPSPDVRRIASKSVPHINDLFESTESDSYQDERDRAFVVLDDRYQNRQHVRRDLYKEQRWMPTWSYSLE